MGGGTCVRQVLRACLPAVACLKRGCGVCLSVPAVAPRSCILPIGLLFAIVLWSGNAAYLYLSVSFIQMLKVSTAAAAVTEWQCFQSFEWVGYCTVSVMHVCGWKGGRSEVGPSCDGGCGWMQQL